MASETGSGMKQTGEELFKNNQGLQAGVKYPSNEDYIKDWKRITPEAREALIKIDDKKLDSDFDMEGMKMSYYDLITYSIFREASVLGQLILWRRLLGYPAMRYD